MNSTGDILQEGLNRKEVEETKAELDQGRLVKEQMHGF